MEKEIFVKVRASGEYGVLLKEKEFKKMDNRDVLVFLETGEKETYKFWELEQVIAQ
jgi:hypothetical protein